MFVVRAAARAAAAGALLAMLPRCAYTIKGK